MVDMVEDEGQEIEPSELSRDTWRWDKVLRTDIEEDSGWVFPREQYTLLYTHTGHIWFHELQERLETILNFSLRHPLENMVTLGFSHPEVEGELYKIRGEYYLITSFPEDSIFRVSEEQGRGLIEVMNRDFFQEEESHRGELRTS